MAVSYKFVQLVKETFNLDEVKAQAFAEAVIAEQVGQAATKEDIAHLKTELKAEIAEFKDDVKSQFATMKHELIEQKTEIKWIKASVLYVAVLITGAAVKYFFHL
ncbi:TPA: hypothetical protein QH074_004346 [Enterobacter hormaechei subsp. steigerwaltii]|nr:hypothetical protein [Enterobacter hormaechei subsp. steigerwaltii]